MKFLVLLMMFISGYFGTSQSSTVAGNYKMLLGSKGAFGFRQFELFEDGTFLFHAHRENPKDIPPVRDEYGKGQYKVVFKKYGDIEQKHIQLMVTQGDIDEKHTLHLGKTKARLLFPSSRNTKTENLSPRLIVYESDVFWLEKTSFTRVE